MTNHEHFVRYKGRVTVPTLPPEMSVYRWTFHDALKWNLNLTDSTGKVGHWIRSLSEFEFDGVHPSRVEGQTVEVLLRLKMTGEDEAPIEQDTPFLCSTPSNHPN